MKNYLVFTILLCLGCGVSAQAQTLKFGHINIEELVSLMPARDSAAIKFQKYMTDLQENFEGMQAEYAAKLNEYNQKSAAWTATILEAKQGELEGMRQRLQQFEASAQNEMQAMQNILFSPVYAEANAAVQKIGKEMGLIYVVNTAGGGVSYIDEDQSTNLLARAKAELKIPAEKVAPTVIGGQNNQ